MPPSHPLQTFLCLFVLDFMDIVTDPISSSDYRREEDPRLFCSGRTGRGPLSETWREDYARVIKESGGGGSCDRALMCAYKLCKVEFRYWGLQGKIESFIHDIGTPWWCIIRDTRNMLSKMLFFVRTKWPISSKISSKFLIFVHISSSYWKDLICKCTDFQVCIG